MGKNRWWARQWRVAEIGGQFLCSRWFAPRNMYHCLYFFLKYSKGENLLRRMRGKRAAFSLVLGCYVMLVWYWYCCICDSSTTIIGIRTRKFFFFLLSFLPVNIFLRSPLSFSAAIAWKRLVRLIWAQEPVTSNRLSPKSLAFF